VKQKPRKVGRPALSKREAKGRITGIRFSPDEYKRIEAAAKASGMKISKWMRRTLVAATNG
jgi:hypothetical protein